MTSIEKIFGNPDENITYTFNGNSQNNFTHDLYKFPTKFIPQVPNWIINRLKLSSKHYIFDPFCGSGTTLVESSLQKIKSLGIDVNPFSVILSKVKCNPINDSDYLEIKESFNKIKEEYKRNYHNFDKSSVPNLPNIRHWFNDNIIEKLTKIKYEIESLDTSIKVKNFHWIILASQIRRFSNADDQSPKPYVSSRFPKNPPNNVMESYEKAFYKGLESIKAFSQIVSKNNTNIFEYDINKLDTNKIGELLKNSDFEKIDAIITSPPYINAFDYVRTFKMELFWLNLIKPYEVIKLKKKHIGTELIPSNIYRKRPKKFEIIELDNCIEKIYCLDPIRAHTVAKFFRDLKNHLEASSKILNGDGHYCYVIGNSRIRKQVLRSPEIIIELAKPHFKKILSLSFEIRNRYLNIPRSGRGGYIKNDKIVILQKVN